MAVNAVSLVLQNFVPLLVHEAKLLKGFHKEFTAIKDELESIQSFLKDADARSEKGERNNIAKTWVKQVREAACCIEDVIDEYMLHLAQNPHKQCQFFHFLHKVFHLAIKLRARYGVASKISKQICARSRKEVKDMVSPGKGHFQGNSLEVSI